MSDVTIAGLCSTCVHARRVDGARSSFLRCGKSDDDPVFPRYPALPVLQCAGYVRRPSNPDQGPRSGER